MEVNVAQLCPHVATPWTIPDSPGRNTGLGSRSRLQQIFPTQGLNLGLPHCRRTLYQLCQQGSPSSWANPRTLQDSYETIKFTTISNDCSISIYANFDNVIVIKYLLIKNLLVIIMSIILQINP